jgi:hypothetical protein
MFSSGSGQNNKELDLIIDFIHWLTHELKNKVNNLSSFYSLVSMVVGIP